MGESGALNPRTVTPEPPTPEPPTSGEVSQDVPGEKRVSWAELFFDLVFVVAITRASELLEHDHGGGGLLRALVVFVPMYWLWVGTSIQANLLDTARPTMQLRIFAVALAGVFMALALPGVWADDATGLALVFAVAYWVGRLVLGVPIVISALTARRVPLNPYAVSMVLTGPMLVVGALLHRDGREVVWAIAALIDLATPTVLARWLRNVHYDAGHLTERFGLFVLIALGESVVAVASSADPAELTIAQGFAIAAAFALSCGLWWVYFQFAADAMRHALATARVQLTITRLVLSYGHLAFIGAVVLVAVGLREAIAEPTHHLGGSLAGLLFGGCALYLASFGFTRWAMFRLVSWTRLSAALVVVLLWPAGTSLPALASLVLLAAVFAALNVIELARVGRIGWRAKRPELAGRS